MKYCIFLLMIIMLMFLSGCANTKQNFHPPKKENSTNYATVNEMNNESGVENDNSFIYEKEMRIYKISRDTFNIFLDNPAQSTLIDDSISKYIYTHSGENHITSNLNIFPIDDELISFLGSRQKVYRFIKNNGVNGNIENMVIFDAPKTPITMWIKIDNKNLFITVRKPKRNYQYDFYTQDEYTEKYGCKVGTLKVNDILVKTENSPKIYNDYADVPLLCVLENLGAEINRYKNKIIISFNNKKFVLSMDECKLYQLFSRKDNLLYQTDGGPIFVYGVNDELMVDTATLFSILDNMGKKILVEIDNETVRITNQ